jgi:hypothetical protein
LKAQQYMDKLERLPFEQLDESKRVARFTKFTMISGWVYVAITLGILIVAIVTCHIQNISK